jgi:hypothetical protein
LDPTGRVRGGHIDVEGAVIECRYALAEPSLLYLFRAETSGKSLIFDPDVPLNKLPYSDTVYLGMPIYCMAIGVIDRKELGEGYIIFFLTRCHFLILVKCQTKPELFKRIGCVYSPVSINDWVIAFQSATKRRIRIV